MPLPTLKVTLDRQSIQNKTRQFRSALRAESTRAVRSIAGSGVRVMQGMEMGVGHEYLATLWDMKPVVSTGDGASTEIFSRAEDQTFENRSRYSGEPSGAEPQFEGDRLVRWLEYGAGPTGGDRGAHPIEPVRKARLAIPTGGGSDFLGTILSERGVEHASFLGQTDGGFALAMHVDHPGFAGNRHLHATRLVLERRLRQEGGDLARRVAMKMT